MPLTNGKYVAPTWANGQSPAIDATELQAMSDTIAKAVPTLASVTLPSASWGQSGNVYVQTVSITGLTTNMAVDVRLSSDNIIQLVSDGVLDLQIVNNNGTAQARCVGAAPSVSLTIQVELTPVYAS